MIPFHPTTAAERSKEELVELLSVLPQESQERVRAALSNAEFGDGENVTEDAVQAWVAGGYSALLRELCEVGLDAHFAHYQQAKGLAVRFLTKLIQSASDRFYVRHDDFDRFWRGLEKKALKSEAEREFQDALRDAKQRAKEGQDEEDRARVVELELQREEDRARLRELELQLAGHNPTENSKAIGRQCDAEFQNAAPRAKGSIKSDVAVRRMDEYREAKGISLTEFATRIKTTDRTLRNFRKTGQIRRDLFAAIALEMGLTVEELLKPA